MKNDRRTTHRRGFALAMGMVSTALYAGVPGGQDELRIYPGAPQRPGESIVSISGRWTTEEELQSGFTGLTFLNGPDRPKPDSPVSVTKKVALSVKRGLAEMGGLHRGILVELDKDSDKPHYRIINKEGFALTKLILRDYINDKYRTEIADESFSRHGVKMSFDIVEAISSGKVTINYSPDESNNFRATGGGVVVTIGDGKTMTVETKDKSTEQIEQALASLMGGQFSTSPLFPDEREKQDEKNIRPFDGGEIQFPNLSASSFTVEVKDTSLGMIHRFLFR
ncbi:MAG: hypothetical protein ACRER2_03585 [Methylococcales bacterium]